MEEAIAEVSEDQVITDIRLHPRVLYGDEMQGEIHRFLEGRYPEELAGALAASGNLHNPKLSPLFRPLREAILATSYVKRLGELLGPSRHRIVGATFEKVEVSTRAKPPRFSAIVWLIVEKAPEPQAEDGAPGRTEVGAAADQ